MVKPQPLVEWVGWRRFRHTRACLAGLVGWWVLGRARPAGIQDQEEIRMIDYGIKRCTGVGRVVRSSLTMAARRASKGGVS